MIFIRTLFVTVITLSSFFLMGCSWKFQPCAEGGDVSWEPKVIGTMECHQKKSEGPRVNHGAFHQWHPNGKLALEGSFQDGKRDGLWSYYNESGEKKMEKYFDNGVEKTVEKSLPKADSEKK
jgi:hypothetical protein